MGAGKTTVGRKLARLLSCDFIDTDHALEKRTGVSVSHIFELEGEHGFRERESRVLAEISQIQNGGAVVATGGGIILREGNRRVMHKTGTVVYLRATPELLWQRLNKNCQSRPLLNAPEPQTALTQLLEARAPLYAAEADITVDACAEHAVKIATKIQVLLHESGYENG